MAAAGACASVTATPSSADHDVEQPVLHVDHLACRPVDQVTRDVLVRLCDGERLVLRDPARDAYARAHLAIHLHDELDLIARRLFRIECGPRRLLEERRGVAAPRPQLPGAGWRGG